MSSGTFSLPSGHPALAGYPRELTTESQSKGVRPPQRLLRYRLLADVAAAQVRQQSLAAEDLEWQRLRIDLVFLHCRLNKLPVVGDPESEIAFHRAALERALDIDGPEHDSVFGHAARLEQLLPRRCHRELIEEAISRLRANLGSFNVMSHDAENSFVFRRGDEFMEFSREPMARRDALAMVEELDRGDLKWRRLETVTRVPVMPVVELAAGQKLWLEVDRSGFWVLVEAFGRRYSLNLPFPSFDEASYYLSGSLSRDLLAGLTPATDWRQSVFGA